MGAGGPTSTSIVAKERAPITISLNPYLGFRGNAREAIEFYHSVFGGDLRLSTFKEFQASEDPAEEDLIMHSQLTTDDGLMLMASDTPSRMPYNPGDTISVSLSGGSEDDGRLRQYWERLGEGAQILEPLEVAPWGDAFGMLKDRFGTTWLVNIAGGQAPQQG